MVRSPDLSLKTESCSRAAFFVVSLRVLSQEAYPEVLSYIFCKIRSSQLPSTNEASKNIRTDGESIPSLRAKSGSVLEFLPSTFPKYKRGSYGFLFCNQIKNSYYLALMSFIRISSFGDKTISVLRFLAFPSGVELSATGKNSPLPAAVRR